MRESKWSDYELIDVSEGEKLERWRDVILVRPDPQAIWKSERFDVLQKKAHAKYLRSSKGGGRWEFYSKLSDSWEISRKDLKIRVKTMGFKHTGVFPEQAVNWDLLRDIIIKSKRKVKILNLFAYTGCATISCALAGAEVCHVDSSKGMVAWAKENAVLSGTDGKSIRWIVDDCMKFVLREISRGNRYDGIIMDPPSYGRGPNGEVWKIEDKIYDLVRACESLMSEDPLFFMINSYTKGLAPSVMGYILGKVVKSVYGGSVCSDETGLPVTESGLVFPCGGTSVWQSGD